MRRSNPARGDAERRRLHRTGELRLAGRTRPLLLALAAVEHQDGEHAARPVPPADEMHGEGAAVLAQQIDIEPGDAPGAPRRANQGGAVGRDDIGESERPAQLRPQAQPLRQRRIDVGDAAVGGDGQQALREVVVEGEHTPEAAHRLQLAGALARHVPHLPERQRRLRRPLPGHRERLHRDLQPAPARFVERPGRT